MVDGRIVDHPFRAAHNEAAKREAIKEILKYGSPDWYTHPEDYKNPITCPLRRIYPEMPID